MNPADEPPSDGSPHDAEEEVSTRTLGPMGTDIDSSPPIPSRAHLEAGPRAPAPAPAPAANAQRGGPFEIQPGAVIKHYEVIRKLGAGGMGVVFLARDTRLGRLVAIKLLLKHSGPAAKRFLVEARTTAQCRHENIVVIYDLGELDGHPYMVLEYIEGQTLRHFMNWPRRASTEEEQREARLSTTGRGLAVELMLPVARALATAHEVGIVHRDLKPENLLLTDSGLVKVLDFGIAKHVTSGVDDPLPDARATWQEISALTQAGALIGTRPYMSPEQWSGAEIDARTDIWAAGIILFELLTGEHPLHPLSRQRLAEVIDLDTPMPSARERRPDAGPLADIIDRCLKKRKEERIGSGKELALALARLETEKTTLPQNEDDSPFAGLSAFQESDAARFFGRDHDIAAVLGRLRGLELVAIAGPSGAGKSSLVRAGILPALKRAGGTQESFVIRPGRRPLAALADVLAFLADTVVEPEATEEGDPEALTHTLLCQPGYLGARLRARCRRRGNGHRILLFVDQAEELYTLGIDPAERSAFCACLEGVADDASSPLRVLLTIRADFLDHLSEDRRFMEKVTRGLVFLPPMTREGLRDALISPVEAAQYRFEDDKLCDEMLLGLEGTKSPLPILQFTATKLWEARDRDRRLLTRDAYRALGGVAGALSTHADAVLSGLSLPEQRLARAILVRLVTPERTRAIVRMDELITLDSGGAVERIVHHLADARLLSIESGGEREGTTVELTHESLIESWARLRSWLDEDEQDAKFLVELRQAAKQWENNGEAEGMLWRDRAALEAQQWLLRVRAEEGAEGMTGLTRREERYLEAVVGFSERARRRRLRVTAMVFAAISALTVVAFVLAIRSREQARRADEQALRADALARRAQEEAVQARNATRMTVARELQGDPTTGIALLREVEGSEVPRGWTDLSRSALYAGVAPAVLTHPDLVYSVAYSPDGKHIVTACEDNTARIWSVEGLDEPLILRGHQDRVSSATFSPDGKRIVTASEDKTARIWNADGTGEPVILRGHADLVMSAAWSPDGKHIVTSSSDRTARIWSADGKGEPVVLRGHEDVMVSALYSPDGERIVTAGADRTARIWSADGTGEPLILRGHQGGIWAATWSPDGKHIVTASSDMTARVWSADSTGEPLILRGHEHRVTSAAWSPDGERIVTGSYDKTARVWSADGKRTLFILRGHQHSIHSVAWSPDGEHIATASEDKTARIWSAEGKREPLILGGHKSSISVAAWSADGERIVTASHDRTARVWSADGKGEPVILRGHEDIVWAAEWSPDDKRIVTGSSDRNARVWSADGAGEPLVLRGHQDKISSVAWSPDGGRILTASEDKTARVWKADGTGEPIVFRGHQGWLGAAVWSPDGKRIATGSEDKTARVWNADGTGEPLVFQGHEDGIISLTWSPDGARFVTVSMDRTARVWDANGRGAPVVLRGHEHWIYRAAFSPDSKRVVTACRDKTARVWNVDGTGEPMVLSGHENEVYWAAFSPDGKRIVTASADSTLRIWNADRPGEPLILRSTGAYNSALWSPDGQRIVAASDDATVSIWSDLEPLRGPLDPRLWTATTYCLPVERRIKLLSVSDAAAKADQQACLRHIAEAPRGSARQDLEPPR